MKKILSLLMAIAMLSVAFFGFSLPASASDIVYPITNPQFEIPLAFTDGNTTQTASFTVLSSGYYIIQTFGFTRENDHSTTQRITIKNGSSIVATTSGPNNFNGYEYGKFLYCQLYENTTYTLEVQSLNADYGRVSFTRTDGLFDTTPPASYYDITSFPAEEVSFDFSDFDREYAQVALVVNSGVTRPYSITVDTMGYSFFRCYLLDPRSLESVEGEYFSSYASMTLETNVPYYLVVMYIEGANPVPVDEVVTVTVTFASGEE